MTASTCIAINVNLCIPFNLLMFFFECWQCFFLCYFLWLFYDYIYPSTYISLFLSNCSCSSLNAGNASSSAFFFFFWLYYDNIDPSTYISLFLFLWLFYDYIVPNTYISLFLSTCSCSSLNADNASSSAISLAVLTSCLTVLFLFILPL